MVVQKQSLNVSKFMFETGLGGEMDTEMVCSLAGEMRGETHPRATDQVGRPRRDGVCASVATHPSSVALAEALPRLSSGRVVEGVGRPGGPEEGFGRTRGAPTAPFLQRRRVER